MDYVNRPQPGEGKYLPGGDLLHSDEAPPQPGIDVDDQDSDDPSDNAGWLQRARDAFAFSTSYVDANYRKKWEDNIRAFNSQHPMDSKYVNPMYSKRSSIYRPKTRAAIRKNEAAAASAFFSNMDVVSIEAVNQGNKQEQASAEIMKELLQYRLTKSVPWFQTVMGGLQDAQIQGVVCAYIYWEYEELDGEIVKDKPCVDLLPVENIRIDPASNWSDPINTSPYLIHMLPMYVCDVKDMMNREDPKTGNPVWKAYGNNVLQQARQSKSDSTRITRQNGRSDPTDVDGKNISDYEIVWIQRHIHKRDGIDWTFYTIGDIALLTDPVPLKEIIFHGHRPYVMGCCILETHKIFPSSLPDLGSGLQEEANALANTRLDNLYFVLNKKYFIKRGKNVDLPALMRNVPGGGVMMDDPETDVKEMNWPDVTSSAYQEQDRLNADFSDLLGDFSPANAQLARKGSEPGKIMQLMAGSASPLTEYLLRTYVETFVEPVLRQLVKLEQQYETDQVVLAIAADRAKLLQKFGMDHVTDDLLDKDLTVKVNVGMGATDPNAKLQKLIMGITAFEQIAGAEKQSPTGLDVSEIAKEMFGFMGYQDGRRFMQSDDDPQKAQLKQQLQHAGHVIQELGKRVQDRQVELDNTKQIAHEANTTKLLVANKQEETKIKVEAIKHQLDSKSKEMDVHKELEIAKIHARANTFAKLEDAKMKHSSAVEVSKHRDKSEASDAEPRKNSSGGVSIPNIKLDPIINVEASPPMITVEAPIINLPDNKPRTRRVKKVANGEWIIIEE